MVAEIRRVTPDATVPEIGQACDVIIAERMAVGKPVANLTMYLARSVPGRFLAIREATRIEARKPKCPLDVNHPPSPLPRIT